jgi:hypothetical protein
MFIRFHIIVSSRQSSQVQFRQFLPKLPRPLMMRQGNTRFVGLTLVAPAEPETLKSTSGSNCAGKLRVQVYMNVEASVLRRHSDTM